MVKLENLYNKYLKIYTKTNFIKWNNNYVSLLTKSYLYLSILFYIVGGIFLIFNKNGIIKYEFFILNGIVFLLLSFFYNKKYQKEFKESFMKFHNLENLEDKDTDYIFYDVFSVIKNEKDFYENKKYLLEFASLEMRKDSFFNQPLFLILVSIILTIIGTVINAELQEIVEYIVYIFILMLFYNLIYTSRQHLGRNKHESFKLFLIKIDYYENSQL